MLTTATAIVIIFFLVLGSCEAADDANPFLKNRVCDAHGGEERAQAYKPSAPEKAIVCEESSPSAELHPHKVAHWSFWRSNYKDLIPILLRGTVYACSGRAKKINESDAILEVWQPRPDGTYSSIRPGVEEGDCRALVPMVTTKHNNNDNENGTMMDNIIGKVKFETFAPGSIGMLNGLVPSSSRDYPPYKPGSIHMFLNIAGYQPLLTHLSLNVLDDWIPKKTSRGRFKLSNGKTNLNNDDTVTNGMKIQSVTPILRNGYELSIEVELNFFLAENDEEKKGIKDIFCSHSRQRGRWSWILSFFNEPISVCFAAYLDFFAL
jgi:protocatechuate 3,4-dioxygenase beta subunit